MAISRWILDHPQLLERAYVFTEAVLRRLEPALRRIGFARLEWFFAWGERVTKIPLFDCRMCGMCNLRGTGMTCPMTCPKNLRNGPCGGVRANGKCEILPDLDCPWVLAWQRAGKMDSYGEQILCIHPPVDRTVDGSSAWLNMLDERDLKFPKGFSECGPTQADVPIEAIGMLKNV